MTSIIKAVFKSTIGLLVNKGRDRAAERLKEGDVTDQKFRRLIVREIEDVKSKLDGLARKDLLASMSFFKEGIELMYVAFEKAKSSESENDAPTAQSSVESTSAEAFSLTKQMMKKLELTGLDESATRALGKAKKRFEEARRKATEAFANEALEISDRLLAMEYRVMATILESVDDPEDELGACKVCLEELHGLSAVQKSFSVEVQKGIRAWFSKDERGQIISNVCHLNRVTYDVTKMVAWRRGEIVMLPCVTIGEDNVDPLRDRRITKVLQKQGMEHCCIRAWSFGQEDEDKHKLKDPCGIATNTKGHFLIADNGDKTVKVFDSNGKFNSSLNPETDDADTKLEIWDVATADVDDKIYLLVGLKKPGAGKWGSEVQVFNKTADLQHKFPVRRGDWYEGGSLTVSGSKVLELGHNVVVVHEENGEFVCSFGQGVFKDPTNITATCDGRVMIVDRYVSCVYIFTVEGRQLAKFNTNINNEGDRYYPIACHPAGEHIVVVGHKGERDRPIVAIYTLNGAFLSKFQLQEGKGYFIVGITVTSQGHIAVALTHFGILRKVVVV